MADKLLVVAHPDDELLFGGGELIKESGWKVICVTNGGNVQRAKEFTHVMNIVKAEHEIWDFPDEWKGDFDRKLLSRKLKKILDENKFTKIVTHNLKGEYGHTQHIALSQVLHDLVKENLYVFGFGDQKLSPDIYRKKLALLHHYSLFKLQKDYFLTLRELKYEQIHKVY
ncbi:PIG-L family deacetylase [Mesobacillus zeae]|uniref:PIG-L family deacetylase n=1 Tax=Mesobacillus zeae TaxID=1917180 RepID=A0A398B2L6_9BACI|nr:PIG-L family deacetylase [Mesobacillus zeae]RID84169.1 PIG-L family deacetylase [Mesobacillus zeae]